MTPTHPHTHTELGTFTCTRSVCVIMRVKIYRVSMYLSILPPIPSNLRGVPRRAYWSISQPTHSTLSTTKHRMVSSESLSREHRVNRFTAENPFAEGGGGVDSAPPAAPTPLIYIETRTRKSQTSPERGKRHPIFLKFLCSKHIICPAISCNKSPVYGRVPL